MEILILGLRSQNMAGLRKPKLERRMFAEKSTAAGGCIDEYNKAMMI